MNQHISYKTAKTPDVEHEFQTQIQKLARRLQVFRPELVHLHGLVEQNSAREGTVVALDLRIPSGEIASKEHGAPPTAAVKAAFAELLKQLARHMEQLRSQRKRRGAKQVAGVPFEETVAAVHAARVSNGDVNHWVDANLDRLERFIARELRYRENIGRLRRGELAREEVLDEAIAMALSDGDEKPEMVSLERWLYRHAIRAIERLAREDRSTGNVHLEESVRKPNVRASDEPQLQFHQPDEIMVEETVIADRSVATPEEIFYSEEMIAMIETELMGAKPEEREAFILSAIEGFTIREIAAIAEKPASAVEADVRGALAHLRKGLPASTPLREILLHPKIA
ncbi:MAG: sigma-70 family RNA polymerase sigma factor [Acidobacteriota bacterium]|nr:sigma-70 family RNA polymerase sigma factor [Acidobacteriota bacterium]